MQGTRARKNRKILYFLLISDLFRDVQFSQNFHFAVAVSVYILFSVGMFKLGVC